MSDKLKCGFDKKDCIEGKCRQWIHLLGKDPQSAATVDKFGCTFEFLPLLLVENAQMNRQTTAAVEDFRNKLVQGVMQIAVATNNQALAAGVETAPTLTEGTGANTA